MVFVTLGSQKFQFNRLHQAVDKLVEQNVITQPVFAQIGASDYVPQHFASTAFLDRDTFAQRLRESSVVITHGGTGAIIGALKQGKPVIAVPRLARYGEHVDDHQMQLLKQFEEMGMIAVCYDLERLGDLYYTVQKETFAPYVSNTKQIMQSIEDFLLERAEGDQ